MAMTWRRVAASSIAPVGLCGVVTLISRVFGRRAAAIRAGSRAKPSSKARSMKLMAQPMARGVSMLVA
jgi:hypothetical protein